MKRAKLLPGILALSMLGAQAASVCAAEPEKGANTNVTITTSVNGTGAITRISGDSVTTDTFSNLISLDDLKDFAATTPSPSAAPEAEVNVDLTKDKESAFYRLLKKYVYMILDEYFADKKADDESPEPTAEPTAASESTETPAPADRS